VHPLTRRHRPPANRSPGTARTPRVWPSTGCRRRPPARLRRQVSTSRRGRGRSRRARTRHRDPA